MKKDVSNREINSKLMSGFFVAGLCIALLFCLLCKDQKFSETENRVLAGFPKFDIQSVIDGDYTADFEKYVSDTVVLRDFWVKLKNTADFVSLKKDNGYAYFGKDERLFPIEEFDFGIYTKNIDAVKELQGNTDIKVSVLLAPTSNLLYADKMPKYADMHFDRYELNRAQDILKENFVDTRGILNEHKNEYIYYRTDHHWTSLGAYYAYSELAKHLGFESKALDEFEERVLATDFQGSTEAKIPTFFSRTDEIRAYESAQILDSSARYEDGKPAKMFDTSFLQKRDKYSYFLGGNHPFIRLSRNIDERVKIGNVKSILLIKDSYANCLAPFLLEHYQDVYVVDLRHYRKSIKTLIDDIRYKDNVELSDIVILYNAPQFSTDVNASLMAR